MVKVEGILENDAIIAPEKYIEEKEVPDGMPLDEILLSINRGIQLKGEQLDEILSAGETDLLYLSLANVKNGKIQGEISYVKPQAENREKFIAKHGMS